MSVMDKRIDWCVGWMKDKMKSNKISVVSVLDRFFVDAFLEYFPSVAYRGTNFGAFRCRALREALAAGYKKGRFDRKSVGLCEHERGFPNWVYVYGLSVKEQADD